MDEYPVEGCPLCSGSVIWALDDRGAWVPIDAQTHPDGSIALSFSWEGHPRAKDIKSMVARFGRLLRLPHLKNCPKPKELRVYHYSPPGRGRS